MNPKKLAFSITEEETDSLEAEERLKFLNEQSAREEDQPKHPPRKKDKRKREWHRRAIAKISAP